jgi:hypothetical protein
VLGVTCKQRIAQQRAHGERNATPFRAKRAKEMRRRAGCSGDEIGDDRARVGRAEYQNARYQSAPRAGVARPAGAPQGISAPHDALVRQAAHTSVAVRAALLPALGAKKRE